MNFLWDWFGECTKIQLIHDFIIIYNVFLHLLRSYMLYPYDQINVVQKKKIWNNHFQTTLMLHTLQIRIKIWYFSLIIYISFHQNSYLHFINQHFEMSMSNVYLHYMILPFSPYKLNIYMYIWSGCCLHATINTLRVYEMNIFFVN